MSAVTTDATKNLLILTYWYPPGIGAAAERMRSFAAYLPEHGWNIRVLCADRGGSGETQESNDTTTVTRVVDHMAKEGPIFADYDPRLPAAPAWKAMLRRFVFPDRFVRWKKAAATAVLESNRRESIDVILASFPPASVVQLALEVHAHTGARLVLDFRDRWLGPGGYEPQSERIRDKHRALEREAVRKAAAVIAVSQNMADAIAEENGISHDRVHVIPNGYEPIADWEAAPADVELGKISEEAANRYGKPLTISHVGTVIPRNRPDLFFGSLDELKRDERIAGLRFRFVGNLSRDYIASIGLTPLVESTGLVDRESARREMRDADALLLLVGDYVAQWGHNAKLFEYVQSGRPILCLEESARSNDAQLLMQFVGDRSFVAPLGDARALMEAVERLRAYCATRPTAAMELSPEFRKYSRRELAASLSEVLDTLR
ncbi:MAG: glycosyltransferase [Phycisphaerales bacterium]|nr:glycosyltransferase [Phycisphaerales bacterium]